MITDEDIARADRIVECATNLEELTYWLALERELGFLRPVEIVIDPQGRI